ncbi:MAG: hypothetical protein HY581_02595 [Nitrospirae bacterium]|nr:hypothetical protein [Nitrospirota bacterium]
MKRTVVGLCMLGILALSGWAGLAVAGHKATGAGTFKPEKIVQGTLKGMDILKETITVEIVEGQKVTLKVDVDALNQIRRTGKIGERVELRLDANDIVQTVAVGTGP